MESWQTRQRETIFQVLKAARGPLTIPEIHSRAHMDKRTGKAGIATIYRTINLLLENSLIQQVILPSGETRYEMAEVKGHHHHHFKCNGGPMRPARPGYAGPGAVRTFRNGQSVRGSWSEGHRPLPGIRGGK